MSEKMQQLKTLEETLKTVGEHWRSLHREIRSLDEKRAELLAEKRNLEREVAEEEFCGWVALRDHHSEHYKVLPIARNVKFAGDSSYMIFELKEGSLEVFELEIDEWGSFIMAPGEESWVFKVGFFSSREEAEACMNRWQTEREQKVS